MISSLPARKIRVLHLVISLEVGGLERVLVNHLRHFDRSRFDVRVLCLAGPGYFAPQIESSGVPVHALNVHGQGLLLGIQTLRRYLRDFRPDVVHTHNPAPHLIGATAARLSGVPVIVHTKHGRNEPRTRRRVLSMRIASLFSSVVVAVSEDCARLVTTEEGVPASRLRVIHNGIDTEAITPPDRTEKRLGQRVISVGRLAAVKDLGTMLKTVQRIARSFPDFRLQLVGDGPERSSLQDLIAELGIGGTVEMLGERRDIAERLSEADIFVQSSISEGLSLGLLEAHAAGLPIVATDVGGNAEVVVHGTTGLLVPPRDPAKLAEALMELLADPDRALSMGRRGRLRVQEAFDLRKVVRRYEELYLELLSRPKAHAIIGDQTG